MSILTDEMLYMWILILSKIRVWDEKKDYKVFKLFSDCKEND